MYDLPPLPTPFPHMSALYTGFLPSMLGSTLFSRAVPSYTLSYQPVTEYGILRASRPVALGAVNDVPIEIKKV